MQFHVENRGVVTIPEELVLEAKDFSSFYNLLVSEGKEQGLVIEATDYFQMPGHLTEGAEYSGEDQANDRAENGETRRSVVKRLAAGAAVLGSVIWFGGSRPDNASAQVSCGDLFCQDGGVCTQDRGCYDGFRRYDRMSCINRYRGRCSGSVCSTWYTRCNAW